MSIVTPADATAISADRAARAPGQVAPIASLLALAWTHFLNDGAANYLPGVLPAVLAGLHIPLRLVGTVMAALLIGQALQPVCGWIADEIGGVSMVLGGVGLSTVAGALVGVMPGYWSLVVMLGLIGIGNAMFHPQALAGIRMLTTTRHGLFLSTFLIGGEIGRGVWPLIASILVVSLGLKGLVLMALPAAVTIPAIVHRIPSIPRRRPNIPRASIRRHLPAMSILIGFASLRATAMYALATFLPILWVERGGSLVGGASIVTVMLLAGIIGNFAGGHLGDRVGRRRLIIVASAMSVIVLATLLEAHGPAVWILLGLLGIATFATLPPQILMGQDLLPENPSLGAGLALGFSNGIGAIAMIAQGLLAARLGIMTVLWLNVAILFAAVAVAPFLRDPAHRVAI
jgi:MFS transporter, FSR family, fosmidomycin resistance protein